MKKCVLYTTLSALFLTVVGVVSAYVGQPTLFNDVVGNITNLFPEHWIVLIPPAVAVLFIILNFIGKGVRRVRRVCAPLGLLVSTVAYLLVAPSAYLEFIVPNTPPAKLLFATGAGFVIFAFLELLVLTLIDTFGRKQPKKVKEEVEAEPEAEEPVEEPVEEPAKEEPVKEEPVKEEPVKEEVKEEPEEEKVERAPAPVEYLDEEVEDEEDLEVETEEEAEDRKEQNKKAKASRAKKAAAPKAKEPEKEPVKKDDKDYDRIYHIMKRAKDDRWIVKIAQSRKAIKIFDTQKEAIAYAEVLASNNNGVVRIFASKGANKGRIIS